MGLRGLRERRVGTPDLSAFGEEVNAGATAAVAAYRGAEHRVPGDAPLADVVWEEIDPHRRAVAVAGPAAPISG
ncbi:MAG: hypothetical protein QOK40_2573 [Miltoncostaeaceae bacterium]|jgi:hypothetical protein|nr:hypothetical protein [Miltoncostaeaceae bacterium]